MNTFCKLTLLATCALAGCAPSYPALTFTVQGEAFHLNGVIDDRALDAFDEAVAAHPQIKTMVFENVPGSVDDDSNLALARRVREGGFATLIRADGMIASGGTDLFLAGTSRNIEPGACIGVHTWGDGAMGSGADLPRDHPDHQMYLAYYDEMGIDREFYWFTLGAAGVDEAHWMSAEEITTYQMDNTPETPVSPPQKPRDCEAR